jgi:hypothetical protein
VAASPTPFSFGGSYLKSTAMLRAGSARLALLVLLLAWSVASCGPAVSPSPLATLPPLVLEPGMGGAKGTVVTAPPDWAGSDITVFFASYYSAGEGQEGFFMLEPSQAPRTQLDSSGAFWLGNIKPGDYVVVIGPTAEAALAIRDAAKPRIFSIVEGEVLDLGSVALP